MNCPKCGKPMCEQKQWPGLWICEDYREPINIKPPYLFKCTGMKLTDEGAKAFDAELVRVVTERN